MNQPDLFTTASASAGTLASVGDPPGAGVPCQNPGCLNFIVPNDASDECCRQCGHAIAASGDPEECAPSDAAAVAPAGPRSKAARIVRLAKAIGIKSDAEQAAEPPEIPF